MIDKGSNSCSLSHPSVKKRSGLMVLSVIHTWEAANSAPVGEFDRGLGSRVGCFPAQIPRGFRSCRGLAVMAWLAMESRSQPTLLFPGMIPDPRSRKEHEVCE